MNSQDDNFEAEVAPPPPVNLDEILQDDESAANNANEDVIIVESINPAVPPPVVGSRQSTWSSTPCRSLKRKLSNSEIDDESQARKREVDDDGCTCPICMDDWEMTGEHRLSSLKCGHLFGYSCIQRWLNANDSKKFRVCPQCKTPASLRDIRFLYAKRLRAIDRSEEHRLRGELNKVQEDYKELHSNYHSLKFFDKINKNKILSLKSENETLRRRYDINDDSNFSQLRSNFQCKLSLEKTVDIAKDGKCRVLLHNSFEKNLIISTKSNLSLFPGFGIRFMDLNSASLMGYISVSSKSVRDMNNNTPGNLLITASQEAKSIMFDLRSHSMVATYKPSENPIWSCAFGYASQEHALYLGTQTGETYIYDVRSSKSCVHEAKVAGDRSSIINILHINENEQFPKGFFLVCKLQSLWFHGHTNNSIVSLQLDIAGPFISMDYNRNSDLLLIVTRNNAKQSHSKFILGTIQTSSGAPTIHILFTMDGSTISPIMNRSTHFAIQNHNFIAGYLQDKRSFSLIDVRKKSYVQSLPLYDTVLDTCSIENDDKPFLFALTESKCRIYNITTQ